MSGVNWLELGVRVFGAYAAGRKQGKQAFAKGMLGAQAAGEMWDDVVGKGEARRSAADQADALRKLTEANDSAMENAFARDTLGGTAITGMDLEYDTEIPALAPGIPTGGVDAVAQKAAEKAADKVVNDSGKVDNKPADSKRARTNVRAKAAETRRKATAMPEPNAAVKAPLVGAVSFPATEARYDPGPRGQKMDEAATAQRKLKDLWAVEDAGVKAPRSALILK